MIHPIDNSPREAWRNMADGAVTMLAKRLPNVRAFDFDCAECRFSIENGDLKHEWIGNKWQPIQISGELMRDILAGSTRCMELPFEFVPIGYDPYSDTFLARRSDSGIRGRYLTFAIWVRQAWYLANRFVFLALRKLGIASIKDYGSTGLWSNVRWHLPFSRR